MGHMLGGKTNATNINDQRSAAKKAEAVLNSLVPSSPRTDAQLDTLRQPTDIANAVIMRNNFSGQTDLNAKRGEAATALPFYGICRVIPLNPVSIPSELFDTALKTAWAQTPQMPGASPSPPTPSARACSEC